MCYFSWYCTEQLVNLNEYVIKPNSTVTDCGDKSIVNYTTKLIITYYDRGRAKKNTFSDKNTLGSVAWLFHQFTTWSLSVFLDFDFNVQNHCNNFNSNGAGFSLCVHGQTHSFNKLHKLASFSQDSSTLFFPLEIKSFNCM